MRHPRIAKATQLAMQLAAAARARVWGEDYSRTSLICYNLSLLNAAMSVSADEVHIAMHDLSAAPAKANAIQFDTSSEWVKKDQWPKFDSWEYTVIFKENLQGAELDSFRKFLGLVEKTGLIGQLFKSPSNDKQLLLKLRASQTWYDERATKLNYLYELKPIVCNVPKEFQDKHKGDNSIHHMYEVFDADEKENFMFEGYHNMYTSFRGAMIEYYLRENSADDVPGCDLNQFVLQKIVCNYYPNHEPERVKWFQSNWILSVPWKDAPIDEIRNYFGEEIAFYFAWLSHFTMWLVAPGILGVCVAFFLASRRIEEMNRSIVGPIFGVLLMIYMTCYLEFWKRRSATLAFKWGVIDFDKREPERPEYEAKETDFNIFTQETFHYYPKEERLKKQLIGLPAVLLTIAIACTVMVIILMWKFVQGLLGPDQQSDPFGQWKIVVPSLCNTVAILVFSKIHRILATFLNDWENYQTQSEYESQLIRKVFFFEFVNNFTGQYFVWPKLLCTLRNFCFLGLLYTAFVLGNMYQLYFAILIQMCVMQFVGNVQAIVMPLISNFIFKRKQDLQNLKLAWSDVLAGNDRYDNFGDFNEIVIQFGYVMFFSAAFPAAALLSWFNNVIEIRLDAHSILTNEPRPTAERKGGIGIWFEIIELMSFIAIVVNALIFALTSDAIGAGVHNFCRFTFQDIDVTADPNSLMSRLTWTQQGCVSFCSSMYQSQKFHNPGITLAPCGTLPVINPSTGQLYPSCRTIPSIEPVECTPQNPCRPKAGPDGVGRLDNNCASPFLCNPVPLSVPLRSERSLLGRSSNRDWSRAYCQESPYVNMGSGEWRFGSATQIYAWNPFLNNFAPPPPSPLLNPQNPLLDVPAYRDVRTSEYGMMSCTLFCRDSSRCPYSQDNPRFNPKLRRDDDYRPMDYISPQQLRDIQNARDVSCVKSGGNQYSPPTGQNYCFLCPSADLELTPLAGGVDIYNEIVFTTLFGPSVAVVWSILIFEHIVLFIKFIVMAAVRLYSFPFIICYENYSRRLLIFAFLFSAFNIQFHHPALDA